MMRRVLVQLFLLCLWSGSSHADIVASDLVLQNVQLVGIRGGVLMARVGSTGDTTGWPKQVTLTLNDHGSERSITGVLAWIGTSTSEQPTRPWSWDGNDNIIRPIRPTDDLAKIPLDNPDSGAYLLAELPEDAGGVLELGPRTYTPRWMHLPNALPALSLGPARRAARYMEAENSPARPMADNPFTWWRWALLAHRLDMRPPPPPSGTAVESLFARHVEQLWRIGLTRLAGESRGIAARCQDLLTETCRDGDTEFATWIVERAPINELLEMLISPEPVTSLVDKALAWTDRQVPDLAWLEQRYGQQIQLAIANPDPDAHVAQFIWSGQEDVPSGERLDGSSVTRVTLNRPAPDIIAQLYPELIEGDVASLNIVVQQHVMTIPFGPATISVKPPGALLGPFRSPRTLLELRTGQPATVPNAEPTFAQLRKLAGRWELFIECVRPQDTAGKPFFNMLRSLDELKGREAVTVLIGLPDTASKPARYALCIPEHEDPAVLVGPRDEPPEVHRRSYADRWLVRFVLPKYWLPDADEPLHLALIRTHGNSMDFETAPNACIPWRMQPDMVQLDLSQWEDGGPQLKRERSRR
ncbi:MAG: hypothetical protein MK095_01210 [Phycisphaerales bacterium]|nr:hypothetical protein [Phycisphaerales bacterium]